MILSVKNLKKSFGANEILSDVSFNIEEKERAAIIGVNGAGKTTVFKLITGELEPDRGELYIKKDSVIGYMPQDAALISSKTVYEEMLTVFCDIIKTENEMRALEASMAGKEGAQLERLLIKYNRASYDFEKKNAYGYEGRIRGVIKGLNFSDEYIDAPVSRLSGGEKTRVALGKLLLTEPDLLLLDEPTNHLDIDSIRWLENYLEGYNGALVIISHDRYFLDKTVGKIIEIENKKSQVYIGNYTEFSVYKEINREIAMRRYMNQQKEITRQKAVIRTFKSYSREIFFKRAASREKLLMKMELADKPENLPEKIRIELTPRVTSGNDVLSVSGVTKGYGTRLLFKDVSFEMKKGEKAALIGSNGIGKTTLFNTIMAVTGADKGKIEKGTNVTIGTYAQERAALTPGKTIVEEISDMHPKMTIPEIRNILAAFAFFGDDVFKKTEDLSGGEAGRVKLAGLMLSDANFLLLDEPTNHLDSYSKDILEDALNNYTGTVLYISHDRYFINATADKVLELSQNGIEVFLGGYDYYMEKKLERAADTPVKTDKEKKPRKRNDSPASGIRTRKNAILKCEEDIAYAEDALKEYEAELEKEEVYTSPTLSSEFYTKKEDAEKRLNELYLLWEKLSEE